jgi:hypothetical protein
VIDVRKVRNKAAFNIGPTAAAASGMTFSELFSFISGGYCPTDAQLLALVGFLKMREEDYST